MQWTKYGMPTLVFGMVFFICGLIQGVRSIDDLVGCNYPFIQTSVYHYPGSEPNHIHTGEAVTGLLVNWLTYIGCAVGLLMGAIAYFQSLRQHLKPKVKKESANSIVPIANTDAVDPNSEILEAIAKQNELITRLLQNLQSEK